MARRKFKTALLVPENYDFDSKVGKGVDRIGSVYITNSFLET